MAAPWNADVGLVGEFTRAGLSETNSRTRESQSEEARALVGVGGPGGPRDGGAVQGPFSRSGNQAERGDEKG